VSQRAKSVKSDRKRGKRATKLINFAEHPKAEQIHLDVFDVRHWFAKAPLECVTSRDALSILRELDFGWRHWVNLPYDVRRAGTVTPARWNEQFWSGLSGYLQQLVDLKLGPRFADYLVGYLLVVENETPGRTCRDRQNYTPMKLRPRVFESDAKRERELHRLKRIVGPPATSSPQRQPSLKLVLNAAMVRDLVASGLSRKIACEERLPVIWAAIGVGVEPASILRTERRIRRKRQSDKY
jgi:hypothetical protein